MVYETYNAGSVKRVQLFDKNATWHTVYENEASQNLQRTRVFTVEFQVSVQNISVFIQGILHNSLFDSLT